MEGAVLPGCTPKRRHWGVGHRSHAGQAGAWPRPPVKGGPKASVGTLLLAAQTAILGRAVEEPGHH